MGVDVSPPSGDLIGEVGDSIDDGHGVRTLCLEFTMWSLPGGWSPPSRRSHELWKNGQAFSDEATFGAAGPLARRSVAPVGDERKSVSGHVYLANDIEALESGRCTLIARGLFRIGGLGRGWSCASPLRIFGDDDLAAGAPRQRTAGPSSPSRDGGEGGAAGTTLERPDRIGAGPCLSRRWTYLRRCA
jgi:hypothetical protein